MSSFTPSDTLPPSGRTGLWLIPGSFAFLSIVLVVCGGYALYPPLFYPRVQVTVVTCYHDDSCVGTWTLNGKQTEGVIENAGQHAEGDVITASVHQGNGVTYYGYIAGGIALIVVGLLFPLYLVYWFRRGRSAYVAKGMRL